MVTTIMLSLPYAFPNATDTLSPLPFLHLSSPLSSSAAFFCSFSVSSIQHSIVNCRERKKSKCLIMSASAEASSSSSVPPLSEKPIVVGCGAAALDILAAVAAFPKPDDKIRSTSLSIQGGGNAGNALTCAARLGLITRLITKVADDSQGKTILEELKADGVDTSYCVVSKEGNSPFTYIIVDSQTLKLGESYPSDLVESYPRELLGSPDKADVLKRTLQVSNLSPLLTVDQLKQLFGFCGTVVECSITDSKHFAYIEYSKPEEATAALALNNWDVGGRPLNVEMAKTLPPKPSVLNSNLSQSSLNLMQQAVALQMQFQQSLLVQQAAINSQQAANRAAMKSATEIAAARAAEISKKLKADGVGNDEKETKRKSRSPPSPHQRSKSRSKSPIKYRGRRFRSPSPLTHRSRDHRSRSPLRSQYRTDYSSERRTPRDGWDSRSGRREGERSHDRYSSVSKRHRSRSVSPRKRKSSRAGSASPKRRQESLSPRARKSSRARSRSPRHHRGSKSSPRHNNERNSKQRRCSRSRSAEGRSRADDRKDKNRSEKLKLEDKKPEKSEDVSKLSSITAKGSREMSSDAILDSSAPTYENLLSDDGTLIDGKDGSRRQKCRRDDRDFERFEIARKDQDGDDILTDLNDDQSSARSPGLKSRDKSAEFVEVKGHSHGKESSRHELSASEKRKHDKTSTLRKERDSSDKERTHAHGRDLSRHGKSNSESKRHEKDDPGRKEKDSICNDSTYSREDWRESSKSKSHRHSSKHLEDSSSRSTKDRHKSDKPKTRDPKNRTGRDTKDSNKREELIKLDKDLEINDEILNEEGCINGGFKERGEDVSDPSCSKFDVEHRQLNEDNFLSNPDVTDYEMTELVGGGHTQQVECIAYEQEYANSITKDLREDKMISPSSKQEIRRRNLLAADEPSDDAADLEKDKKSVEYDGV